MFTSSFAPQLNLRSSSRVPAVSERDQVSAAELACLLGCGALAALAVGMVHMRMGVPGHAILRAVLPMALGLAVVPRRLAGMTMAIGAGCTSAVMSAAHIGFFPHAAMLSVLALGPILDLALLGKPQGWQLYVRFAAAGAAANLLAIALKTASIAVGWGAASGGNFARYGMMAYVTFAVCGTVAGLVSAAVWFRLRVDDDLRRA